jgi:hypothetical protein
MLMRNGWPSRRDRQQADDSGGGRRRGSRLDGKVNIMLYTIAIVLIMLWLLGFVTSYTLGGFIHVLLVIALVMIVLNVLSGRRAV